MNRGLCPKCLDICRLTKHHIHPQRFFTSKNPALLHLCRECHEELEKLIPQHKVGRKTYEDIARAFIVTTNPIFRWRRGNENTS